MPLSIESRAKEVVAAFKNSNIPHDDSMLRVYVFTRWTLLPTEVKEQIIKWAQAELSS